MPRKRKESNREAGTSPSKVPPPAVFVTPPDEAGPSSRRLLSPRTPTTRRTNTDQIVHDVEKILEDIEGMVGASAAAASAASYAQDTSHLRTFPSPPGPSFASSSLPSFSAAPMSSFPSSHETAFPNVFSSAGAGFPTLPFSSFAPSPFASFASATLGAFTASPFGSFATPSPGAFTRSSFNTSQSQFAGPVPGPAPPAAAAAIAATFSPPRASPRRSTRRNAVPMEPQLSPEELAPYMDYQQPPPRQIEPAEIFEITPPKVPGRRKKLTVADLEVLEQSPGTRRRRNTKKAQLEAATARVEPVRVKTPVYEDADPIVVFERITPIEPASPVLVIDDEITILKETELEWWDMLGGPPRFRKQREMERAARIAAGLPPDEEVQGGQEGQEEAGPSTAAGEGHGQTTDATSGQHAELAEPETTEPEPQRSRRRAVKVREELIVPDSQPGPSRRRSAVKDSADTESSPGPSGRLFIDEDEPATSEKHLFKVPEVPLETSPRRRLRKDTETSRGLEAEPQPESNRRRLSAPENSAESEPQTERSRRRPVKDADCFAEPDLQSSPSRRRQTKLSESSTEAESQAERSPRRSGRGIEANAEPEPKTSPSRRRGAVEPEPIESEPQPGPSRRRSGKESEGVSPSKKK